MQALSRTSTHGSAITYVTAPSMPDVLEQRWVGRRVSVRRVVGTRPDGRPVFGDVVGDLVRLDGTSATGLAVIDSKTGPIEVDLATITIAKPAPPSTAEELALEAAAAQGWQAAEVAPLDGWLLRADSGFTARANSVLPLRPLKRPLDEALDAARAWYADRGLPLRLLVPTEARRLLDAELGERGWDFSPDVHVMAVRLDQLGGSPSRGVELLHGPDERWLARFRDGAATGPAVRALLTRHETVTFALVRDGDRAAAIGRGSIDAGWLGVTAVEVDPARRRHGLATAIMAALHEWGRAHGAVRSYLQVSSDNAAALALYQRLGYWVHHDYRCRLDPARPT